MATNKNICDIQVDDVRIEYTSRTGKTLPIEFWQYWIEWHTAWINGKINEIKMLCNHPNMKQYAEWMRMVKDILNTSDPNKKAN